MKLKEFLMSNKHEVCRLFEIEEPALRARIKKNNWTVKDCKQLSDKFNLSMDEVVNSVIEWK